MVHGTSRTPDRIPPAPDGVFTVAHERKISRMPALQFCSAKVHIFHHVRGI
jgi:hypothetical protein